MISLMDITNARLEAIIYKRVEETLSKRADTKGRRMRDLAAICAFHGHCTVEDIRGPSRRKVFSEPRQEFMRAAHDEGFTLTQIGNFLGGRDHTTIIHGIRAARERAGT